MRLFGRPSCSDREPEPKSLEHFDEGRKLRIAVRRESFVEVSAAKAGGLRNLGHALGACDVAERRLQQIRIAVLENGIEIRGNVFFGFESVSCIPEPSPDYA
jgi:hypothetical protein